MTKAEKVVAAIEAHDLTAEQAVAVVSAFLRDGRSFELHTGDLLGLVAFPGYEGDGWYTQEPEWGVPGGGPFTDKEVLEQAVASVAPDEFRHDGPGETFSIWPLADEFKLYRYDAAVMSGWFDDRGGPGKDVGEDQNMP